MAKTQTTEANAARRRKPGETSSARYELRMTEREKQHWVSEAERRGESIPVVLRRALEKRYGVPE
jgi:hypothetical protein